MSFCLVGRGAILLATLFVRAGATETLPWLCDERGGCWPQTWLIGCMKCSSTSFFYWLNQNRGVCAAAVVEHVSSNSKETNFWTRNSTRNSDGAAFPTLYPAARRGECAGGFVEATPTNMRVPATPGALAAALPAAFRGALRFVAVLREPVSRDVSDYYMQKRRGEKKGKGAGCPACRGHMQRYETFAACRLDRAAAALAAGGRNGTWAEAYDVYRRKCAEGLHSGFYARQLENWVAHFPRRHLFVVELGWLASRFDDASRRVSAFLRLPAPAGAEAFPDTGHNRTKDQKTIACAVRDRLEALYAPENERLYAFLAAEQGPDDEPPFPRFARYPCEG